MIFHQFALVPDTRSTLSCAQLEYNRNDVNDKSTKVRGGLQRIKTFDGHEMPLDIKLGLPYLKIRPYTDEEFAELPHIVMTDDTEWDPTVLDCVITDEDEWHDAVSEVEENLPPCPAASRRKIDAFYVGRGRELLGDGYVNGEDFYDAFAIEVMPTERYYESIRDCLLGNLADLLTKRVSYQRVYRRLVKLLFWEGDTMDTEDK